MLRIRLSRGGRKHQPHYRVVVADQDSPRDGRFVEKIGYFSPMTKPDTVKIEESRALYWLSVGAQPSDAVRRLLEKQGTFARLQRLHKGETFNQLMTEYHGAPWPPVVEAAPVATKKPSVAKPAAQNVVAEVFAQPAPEPVVTEATISAEPVVAVAEVVEQVSPLVIDKTPTDLTKIEGVGPKIAEILNNAGIVNYAQLANTSAEQLKEILVAAGGRYKMATPDTWPQQASLAVSGDWEALKQLQGELAGGRAV